MDSDSFLVKGPTPLIGEVDISGAKNAALPILFASLLCDEPIELYNVPQLQDVVTTMMLLRNLGSVVHLSHNACQISNKSITDFRAPKKWASAMRASIWLLAPLLARHGKGTISMPGGCAIGARPIDLHLSILKKMGARFRLEDDLIHAEAPRALKGCHIFLEKISVGATITAIMAGTLARGKSTIIQAACEPEVVDIANFLVNLGANISGAGTSIVTIEGVAKLHGGSYHVQPDRIETGSFLIAAAVSRGAILCRKTNPSHLVELLSVLKQSGAHILVDKKDIYLEMKGRRPKAVDIVTAPYPGFPTDMQAQITLLNCIANGKSTICETIFENRFLHIPELSKMGAKLTTVSNRVLCSGVQSLHGAAVVAKDLRGSLSLLLAGCIANGETHLQQATLIDRGYEGIQQKLVAMGANVERFSAPRVLEMTQRFGSICF